MALVEEVLAVGVYLGLGFLLGPGGSERQGVGEIEGRAWKERRGGNVGRGRSRGRRGGGVVGVVLAEVVRAHGRERR